MPTPQEIAESHAQMVQELKSQVCRLDLITPDELHAILGVAGESGELIDAIKKTIFYGLPLDKVNCDEEFGDKTYFIQLWCFTRGITIFDLMAQNEAKLRQRYPEGKFVQDRAVNRDLEAEREVLEQYEKQDESLSNKTVDELLDLFGILGPIIPRPSVARFAKQMELTLCNHDAAKGGQNHWSMVNMEKLLYRAKEELEELRQAISTGDPTKIINEATDVANFVMMIADNASIPPRD